MRSYSTYVLLTLMISVATKVSAAEPTTIPVPESKVENVCDVKYSKMKALLEQEKLGEARAVFEQLFAECDKNTQLYYEYADVLTEAGAFRRAGELLDELLLGISTGTYEKKLAVYNMRGYIAFVLGEYEEAVEFFQAALLDIDYAALSETTKVKLNNNIGVVLRLLERYPEAREHFLVAKKLGSRLGEENLASVESILAVLEEEPAESPGIFATVVGSVESFSELNKAQSEISNRLGIASSELTVFRTNNGRLAFAYGTNLSIAKAQDRTEKSRVHGINDAYITSALNWELVETPE